MDDPLDLSQTRMSGRELFPLAGYNQTGERHMLKVRLCADIRSGHGRGFTQAIYKA